MFRKTFSIPSRRKTARVVNTNLSNIRTRHKTTRYVSVGVMVRIFHVPSRRLVSLIFLKNKTAKIINKNERNSARSRFTRIPHKNSKIRCSSFPEDPTNATISVPFDRLTIETANYDYFLFRTIFENKISKKYFINRRLFTIFVSLAFRYESLCRPTGFALIPFIR